MVVTSLTRRMTTARSPTLTRVSTQTQLLGSNCSHFCTAFGGTGGETTTGTAVAGSGDDRGPGGNASSGNSGNARGGSVGNFGGSVDNTGGSNIAGDGGTSTTGDAVGGNVSSDDGFGDDDGFDDGDIPDVDDRRRK